MNTPTSDVSYRPSPQQSDVYKLIQKYRNTRIPWIVNGLWKEGGIAVLHALEGQFKSILVYQLAEAIATGEQFLRFWNVPQGRRVGIFQSEMSDHDSGERLARMFPKRSSVPANLCITDEDFKRAMAKKHLLSDKFSTLEQWIREKGIDVVLMDTINGLLAAEGNPNDEHSSARFLDCLSQLPIKGSLLVRHDGKPTKETEMRADNQKVRGSNRLVEDASLVMRVSRKGRAEHQVTLSVGKLRNNAMPDDLTLWFDAGTCRLTPLDPVIAILDTGPLSREDLIRQAHERFRLKRSATETHVNEMGAYLAEGKDGHRRIWQINREAAVPRNNDGEPVLWWLPSVLCKAAQNCIVAEDSGIDVEPSISTPQFA